MQPLSAEAHTQIKKPFPSPLRFNLNKRADHCGRCDRLTLTVYCKENTRPARNLKSVEQDLTNSAKTPPPSSSSGLIVLNSALPTIPSVPTFKKKGKKEEYLRCLFHLRTLGGIEGICRPDAVTQVVGEACESGPHAFSKCVGLIVDLCDAHPGVKSHASSRACACVFLRSQPQREVALNSAL